MKTPSSSRIIGAEDITGVRPFALSEISRRGSNRAGTGGSPARQAAPPQPRDAASFEMGVQQGRREGFAQGLESGRRQAAEELARQRGIAGAQVAQRAGELADALAGRYAEIEGELSGEIAELAIELARQMVGRTLRIEPDAVVSVVRDAIAAFVDERASFAIHVNPGDAEIVAGALAETLESRGGRVVPDRSIAAGGCRVLTANAETDATVGSRWRRVLASIGHAPIPQDPLCND